MSWIWFEITTEYAKPLNHMAINMVGLIDQLESQSIELDKMARESYLGLQTL